MNTNTSDMCLTSVLLECVKAAGGSKVMGAKLWPEKMIEQAQRTLLDCLNEDRPHQLRPEQVVFIARMARDVGCHAYMEHLAQQLHYARPVPREPHEEMAELQRAFVAGLKMQEVLMAQMQQLSGLTSTPPLKAVA